MTRPVLTLFAAGLGLMMATLPTAQAFAAPGVSPWNRDCIRIYSQWKKKPKHKAFAVIRVDNTESCGATWGAPSRKAAEESARKWCKKVTFGGGTCRVTASE